MNKIILFAVVLALIAGCRGNSRKTQQQEGKTEEQALTDAHNALNATDYTGTYSGVVPCADCEGIQTEITLDLEDYTMKTKYLGKEDRFFEDSGKYYWDDDGVNIILEGVKEGPSMYRVGDNVLIQLALDGSTIEGPLADMYRLEKIR